MRYHSSVSFHQVKIQRIVQHNKMDDNLSTGSTLSIEELYTMVNGVAKEVLKK